jgi:hypothetical protein
MERALRGYLRRRWLLATGGALLLLGGIGWGLARFLPARTDFIPPASVPLEGQLLVKVWSPDGKRKPGLAVEDPGSGAVPVRNGEVIHLEARLNRPAHIYLLGLGSQSEVATFYPWDRADDLDAAPPEQSPKSVVHSPEKVSKGWPVEGKKGLETVLLLARSTPLPADMKLAGVVGRLPPTPFRNPREVAVLGFNGDQPVEPMGLSRGFAKEAREIDEPLLRLLGRLQEHFELTRAVRFAHEGD